MPESSRAQSLPEVAQSRPGPAREEDWIGEKAPSVNEALGRLVARLLDDIPADPRETVPLRDLLQTMAVEGTRVVPGTDCVISVVPTSRQDVFQVVAASGPWAEGLIGKEWPLHDGMLHGRALRHRLPVETENAPGESAAPEVFGTHIRIGRLVPMSTGIPLPDGRVGMGVVGFWRPEGRRFSDTERAIMDRFTQLVSIMVVGDEARSQLSISSIGFA